jgi:hypothetical protein
MVIGMATSSRDEWEIGERWFGGALSALAALVSPRGATDVLGDDRLSYRADDVAGLRSRLLRSEFRDALEVLAHRHSLALVLSDGWLRATWTPIGFFIFPGRFEPEKWQEVLAHMLALAKSMEAA